ncbi:ABC transporter ATP-binding protein [Aliiruegeria lutimaris]|uniref:Amino acid/amide ABC transporter ATP-binding protein 2, HAAT family n=1 Tax=Aliiruegeria lutimaris TaxID=571298 RepID=A0A1G8T7L8_9RHOB|nr:ABC transporter ATP-binding protein [Aliiruegeria lutimaris]SDJ37538.1 amino acid/amide ABC transporter ATP-binding protein 2, HAAT family [Aliiruegeria lutimaris]
MSLLSLSNVAASYGASQALFSIELQIGEGECVALMGRNGMGKTTTVKAICRMIPASGTLRFAGQDLTRLTSDQVARLGIGLVPEGRRCFADLTVSENLIVSARKGPWDIDRVTRLFPRLKERQGQRASSLSGGEQQMLAIGRALMTNPRLLLLDEATEGLAPVVRQEIWTAIDELKSGAGLAILVIDKSIQELRKVCDRATIIERGRTVWTGTMPELSRAHSERHLGV